MSIMWMAINYTKKLKLEPVGNHREPQVFSQGGSVLGAMLAVLMAPGSVALRESKLESWVGDNVELRPETDEAKWREADDWPNVAMDVRRGMWASDGLDVDAVRVVHAIVQASREDIDVRYEGSKEAIGRLAESLEALRGAPKQPSKQRSQLPPARTFGELKVMARDAKNWARVDETPVGGWPGHSFVVTWQNQESGQLWGYRYSMTEERGVDPGGTILWRRCEPYEKTCYRFEGGQ